MNDYCLNNYLPTYLQYYYCRLLIIEMKKYNKIWYLYIVMYELYIMSTSVDMNNE